MPRHSRRPGAPCGYVYARLVVQGGGAAGAGTAGTTPSRSDPAAADDHMTDDDPRGTR